MAKIEIWEPRYKDNKVLINPNKVALHNIVYFTKAKHLLGKEFYISGEEIKKHPLQSNGRGMVHCVPMDKLELIREEEVVSRNGN